MPAVEAGLQPGTLIKRHAESFGNQKSEWSEWDERHGRQRREGSGRVRREVPRYKSEIIHPTSCSKTRTTSSEPAQWLGRAAEEPQSAIRNQQSNLKSLRLAKPRSALHVFTKRNHESDSVSIYRGRNQFGNRGAVW